MSFLPSTDPARPRHRAHASSTRGANAPPQIDFTANPPASTSDAAVDVEVLSESVHFGAGRRAPDSGSMDKPVPAVLAIRIFAAPHPKAQTGPPQVRCAPAVAHIAQV